LDANRLAYETRLTLAEMFHVGDALRVVFTCNATESLNIAIQGLLQADDHCVTTILEHNSVLRPLYRMRERGVDLCILPADGKGRVSPTQIKDAIRPSTKAVALAHASNVTGNVSDLYEIGRICKVRELLLIVDAAQSAGFLPIDMQEMGIAALCFSGHKHLLGPQGTGALCLAEGVLPAALKLGGTGTNSSSEGMPSKLPEALEAGTLNTHGLSGLLAACAYAKEYRPERLSAEALALTERFAEGVREIPGIVLYGDFASKRRIPLVALNLRDIPSNEVADALFENYAVAVRAGTLCAPGAHEALGTVRQGLVRFSFSHFNTAAEVDYAVGALRTLGEEL
jgi:cysteine desulfurase family protein